MIVHKRNPAAHGARGAPEIDPLDGEVISEKSRYSLSTQVIRAELIGTHTCSAVGVTVRVGTPVLALCRRLIAVGYAAATPLLVYRGAVLALTVRSIGEGACLEINAKGTGFIRHRPVRTGPPVRANASVDVRGPISRVRARVWRSRPHHHHSKQELDK